MNLMFLLIIQWPPQIHLADSVRVLIHSLRTPASWKCPVHKASDMNIIISPIQHLLDEVELRPWAKLDRPFIVQRFFSDVCLHQFTDVMWMHRRYLCVSSSVDLHWTDSTRNWRKHVWLVKQLWISPVCQVVLIPHQPLRRIISSCCWAQSHLAYLHFMLSTMCTLTAAEMKEDVWYSSLCCLNHLEHKSASDSNQDEEAEMHENKHSCLERRLPGFCQTLRLSDPLMFCKCRCCRAKHLKWVGGRTTREYTGDAANKICWAESRRGEQREDKRVI